ncbi:hypothetical protein BLOT_002264 [Blomia tropicalis]|nr:hypothetical protein BLOT_002264 [Blomia tropicalis]
MIVPNDHVSFYGWFSICNWKLPYLFPLDEYNYVERIALIVDPCLLRSNEHLRKFTSIQSIYAITNNTGMKFGLRPDSDQ